MTLSDTPLFIGDELSAAGYRLAGARTLSPELDETARVFEEQRKSSHLIVITAEYAAKLSREAVSAARRAGTLVAIVPDAREQTPMPDAGERLRSELGVLA